MTTSELSLEQQLELAKKACRRIDDGAPDPQIGNHGIVMVFDCRNHEMGWFDFDPNLEGTAEQMADALRVIVAAHELCKFNMEARAEFEHALGDGIINDRHDLLHASALALLGDKT